MRKKIFFVFVFCLLAFGALKITNAQATCSSLSATDAQCYLDRYTDLQAVFGTSISAAQKHWLQYGCAETRRPSCATAADLTPAQSQCYLNRYADLSEAFGNDLIAAQTHYWQYGRNEGRDASCPSSSGSGSGSGSSTPTPTPGASGSSISNPLTITTTSLPKGVLRQSYVAFIDATGGNNSDYTWTITGLPEGIVQEQLRTLSNTIANIPGIYITGKPTLDGVFHVSFTLKSGAQTATKMLNLTIDTILNNPDVSCEFECCGNFRCDPLSGETPMNCAQDCGKASTACSDNPSTWYLNRYPDVKANGGDARIHYCAFGRNEGPRENCFPANTCDNTGGGSSTSWLNRWTIGGLFGF